MKNEKKIAENMIIFLLENNNSKINEKNINEIVNLETRYFNSFNECINDDLLLFNVRKPSKNSQKSKNTIRNDTSSNRKIKTHHLSPILFVRLQLPSCKYIEQINTQMVKNLIDSEASKSSISK